MRGQFPIIGVWDDHDYGLNDQGKHFKNKHIQKQMYLDFIQEPLESQRRTEVYEGLYQDYTIINRN